MKKTNDYIEAVFVAEDPLLEGVVAAIKENGMPSISVSPVSGKLLTMLVSMSGARNILEIGALGGYSGICLARGFGDAGTLTSLELEDSYAKLAHSKLTEAGYGNQVSYRTGPALQTLDQLAKEGKRFDFFFIDADKENYENYLEACIRLAEPGAWIVADNVLARGSVADEAVEPTGNTEIMRKFNKVVAEDLRLESVLIPVGDGLTLSQVKK